MNQLKGMPLGFWMLIVTLVLGIIAIVGSVIYQAITDDGVRWFLVTTGLVIIGIVTISAIVKFVVDKWI